MRTAALVVFTMVAACSLSALSVDHSSLSFPSVSAQEFQYQFQDKPRPDADVVVVRHSIRQGPGADLYLVGRVFNRGLKPARNVRVSYTILNKYGARYPSGKAYARPADVPPTSFGDFEGRILVTIDPREVFVEAQAEWDE